MLTTVRHRCSTISATPTWLPVKLVVLHSTSVPITWSWRTVIALPSSTPLVTKPSRPCVPVVLRWRISLSSSSLPTTPWCLPPRRLSLMLRLPTYPWYLLSTRLISPVLILIRFVRTSLIWTSWWKTGVVSTSARKFRLRRVLASMNCWRRCCSKPRCSTWRPILTVRLQVALSSHRSTRVVAMYLPFLYLTVRWR